MDPNKVANVRPVILTKNRLTSAEIEDIKKTTKEPTYSEKQSPEDVGVRMEHMI